MSNVVLFERKVPHASGDAFCMQCNHTWVAVAPTGTTELECPACHTHKGRFKFACAPSEAKVWTCRCDNQLFNITEAGMFCPNCGHYQEFP